MKKYVINRNNTEQWKEDVKKSVMFYNDWFLAFAPSTYINARQVAINRVNNAFQKTDCFNLLSTDILKSVPEAITILRMATTPPLARDRLVGLSEVPKSLITSLEDGKLPAKMAVSALDKDFRFSRILRSNKLYYRCRSPGAHSKLRDISVVSL